MPWSTYNGPSPALLRIRAEGAVSRWVDEHAPEWDAATRHVYNVLRGEILPSPVIYEELPKALGMTPEEAFTPEQLAGYFLRESQRRRRAASK